MTMIITINDKEYYFENFLPIDDLFELGFPQWQLIQKMQDKRKLSPEEGMELYKYFLLFLKRIQKDTTDVGQLDLGTILQIIQSEKMQECIARSFGQNAVGLPVEEEEEGKKV